MKIEKTNVYQLSGLFLSIFELQQLFQMQIFKK